MRAGDTGLWSATANVAFFSHTKIVKKLNVMNKISPQNFIDQLENNLVISDFSDKDKAQICQIIADCDKRLATSSDQEVQLLGCIAKLCIILGGNNL